MYYINLGRWADNIIGPFEYEDDAEAYRMRRVREGSRVYENASIVGVKPPLVRKIDYTFRLTHDDAAAVTEFLKAREQNERVNG